MSPVARISSFVTQLCSAVAGVAQEGEWGVYLPQGWWINSSLHVSVLQQDTELAPDASIGVWESARTLDKALRRRIKCIYECVCVCVWPQVVKQVCCFHLQQDQFSAKCPALLEVWPLVAKPRPFYWFSSLFRSQIIIRGGHAALTLRHELILLLCANELKYMAYYITDTLTWHFFQTD